MFMHSTATDFAQGILSGPASTVLTRGPGCWILWRSNPVRRGSRWWAMFDEMLRAQARRNVEEVKRSFDRSPGGGTASLGNSFRMASLSTIWRWMTPLALWNLSDPSVRRLFEREFTTMVRTTQIALEAGIPRTGSRRRRLDVSSQPRAGLPTPLRSSKAHCVNRLGTALSENIAE